MKFVRKFHSLTLTQFSDSWYTFQSIFRVSSEEVNFLKNAQHDPGVLFFLRPRQVWKVKLIFQSIFFNEFPFDEFLFTRRLSRMNYNSVPRGNSLLQKEVLATVDWPQPLEMYKSWMNVRCRNIGHSENKQKSARISRNPTHRGRESDQSAERPGVSLDPNYICPIHRSASGVFVVSNVYSRLKFLIFDCQTSCPSNFNWFLSISFIFPPVLLEISIVCIYQSLFFSNELCCWRWPVVFGFHCSSVHPSFESEFQWNFTTSGIFGLLLQSI